MQRTPRRNGSSKAGNGSLRTGRSRNHKLGILDLIPVLSYVFLKAKCRYCKESISWQYPVVELVTGFLFFAVLEGLHEDGMPIGLAKKIAQEENGNYFVPKCPICMPVQQAFQAYSKGKMRITGNHLEESTQNNLVNENKTIRHESFKKLIDKYVDRYFAKLKLSGKEKKALKKLLEENREIGMTRKRDAFGSFCPSCDGACGK